jgi:hypothetical protein
MKVKIIRTVAPDVRYTDADTGQPDARNRQASEPIRVLPVPVGLKPVTDEDLECIRKVLAYDRSSKLKCLARLIGTSDDESTESFIHRGNEFVLQYYSEKLSAERRAVWDAKEAKRQASHRFRVFRNKVVEVDGWETASREEIVTRVKHKVLSEEKAFTKMQREIELFQKLERKSLSNREPIPDDVRIFVWRRDDGRCVRRGSDHNLEYDHIIPIAKGGSNTERNIRLLCKSCNRTKGSVI